MKFGIVVLAAGILVGATISAGASPASASADGTLAGRAASAGTPSDYMRYRARRRHVRHHRRHHGRYLAVAAPLADCCDVPGGLEDVLPNFHDVPAPLVWRHRVHRRHRVVIRAKG